MWKMMDLDSLVFQSTSAIPPQPSPTPEYQYDCETKLYRGRVEMTSSPDMPYTCTH